MTRTSSRISKQTIDETESPEHVSMPPPRPASVKQVPSTKSLNHTLLQPLVMQFSIALQVLFFKYLLFIYLMIKYSLFIHYRV